MITDLQLNYVVIFKSIVKYPSLHTLYNVKDTIQLHTVRLSRKLNSVKCANSSSSHLIHSVSDN